MLCICVCVCVVSVRGSVGVSSRSSSSSGGGSDGGGWLREVASSPWARYYLYLRPCSRNEPVKVKSPTANRIKCYYILRNERQ